MRIEQIRTAHQTRPFLPLSLHLFDGRTLSVFRPEFMAIMPGERKLFVSHEDGSINIVSIAEIVSLSIRSMSAAESGRRQTA